MAGWLLATLLSFVCVLMYELAWFRAGVLACLLNGHHKQACLVICFQATKNFASVDLRLLLWCLSLCELLMLDLQFLRSLHSGSYLGAKQLCHLFVLHQLYLCATKTRSSSYTAGACCLATWLLVAPSMEGCLIHGHIITQQADCLGGA